MDKKPFRLLLGKQIVTKEGKKLGSLRDITFEARTGELIHIVLKDLTTYTSNLSLEKTKDREALVPYNSVIAVGDFIVVSEEDLLQ
jgi:sporulation protein YlmC with PRC-barrel domain|tara:strand:- start:280 stop:537 length:258 start_codon:yes stop_codon:yes gene_type:complete